VGLDRRQERGGEVMGGPLDWLVIQKCPEGYSCQVVSPYFIWIVLLALGLGLILYSCLNIWDRYESWKAKKKAEQVNP